MMKLSLFLALLLLHSACLALENVALQGVATMSDRALDSTAAASNAIDGDRDSNFYAGSCAATILQHDPWWKVDLLASHVIKRITITNRGDCCGDRIDGLQIYVDDELVAIIAQMGVSETITEFFYGRAEGREVKLVLPGENRFLVVCEVEVYGVPTASVKVHSLVGIASQSSLFDFRSYASNAIDGNPDSTWENGACSCTGDMLEPWWRMDLLSRHKVFSVKITNRNDHASVALDGAEIHIGDSPKNHGVNNPRCAVISSIPAGETAEFLCCSGMDGRYVTINLPGKTTILSMCEVQVFGFAL